MDDDCAGGTALSAASELAIERHTKNQWPPINPATNAHYRVSTAPTLCRLRISSSIRELSNQVSDGDFAYNVLGSVTSTTGTLRIELDNVANGDVILTNPQAVNNPLDVRHVQLTRDPQTLAVLASGYAEPLAGWVDLKYATGTGNDPLWESDILRPVFRACSWTGKTAHSISLTSAMRLPQTRTKSPAEYALGATFRRWSRPPIRSLSRHPLRASISWPMAIARSHTAAQ